jgi:DNA-binding transcriptional MerR regulator
MQPPVTGDTLSVDHRTPAKAAGVGVETVRYYQSRGLLRVPAANGGFRVYPAATIDRIAFIKRAQALGFTLDEVRSLLDLEDGRNRRAIQSVTQARLARSMTSLRIWSACAACCPICCIVAGRPNTGLPDHRDAGRSLQTFAVG